MSRPDLTLAREFEAALAWWRAAGVTHDFADDATAWLGPEPLASAFDAPHPDAPGQSTPARPTRQLPETRAPRLSAPAPEPARAAVPRRDLLGDSPPADLAAFRSWWMDAQALAPATGFARVGPRGDAGARLMVLVPQPEAADTTSLLSGPQGRLLANILAAMGLEESEAYVAAALPCHMPMADLAALAAGGMDAVTAHHVGLVAPRRLIAFGTALAPLLTPLPGAGGTSPDDPGLRVVNHKAGKTPVLLSETLEAMLDMPRLKARFWRRWMEWSAS
jgi:DNA polymerase